MTRHGPLAALLGLVLCAASAAAQVTITADASKVDVTIDEQIALSVTVAGPDASVGVNRLLPWALRPASMKTLASCIWPTC